MKALRDVFGEELVHLGQRRADVYVMTADLATTSRLEAFARAFPERFVQTGIAEQNMIGMAAGLAATGKTVFAVTLAVFATRRVLDQIAISVAFPRLNVKVVGVLTGLYASKTGATHQALEDIAIMRALPNMTVVVPADPLETRLLVNRVADHPGPVYLRVASIGSPDVFHDGYEPVLGRAEALREGTDVTLVSTGIMTARAVAAGELLHSQGIEATVLHVHTVKPLDEQAIVAWAGKTGAVITVENHRIVGGLGSAVAEVLGEQCPVRMRRIGVPDVFGESGTDDELTEKYGLSARHVVEAARQILNTRG